MEIIIGAIGFVILYFLSDRIGFLTGKTVGRIRKNMRFGIYKDDVDGFIICIQVYIPERNEKVLKLAHLNAQQGKTPDYNNYLDISPNFRKLTKDDFMKIALHDSCYVVFDILVRIYRGRHEVKNMREVEEGKDDDLKFTKNAYKARNALFF